MLCLGGVETSVFDDEGSSCERVGGRDVLRGDMRGSGEEVEDNSDVGGGQWR